jgi:hypothetical protein
LGIVSFSVRGLPVVLAGALAARTSAAQNEPARPQPPAPEPSPGAAPQPLSTSEQDEDYIQVVEARSTTWSSPRGLGDVRIKRELLEASPRQQTSEMLSAAPGFFVDHEDTEGLGNDVNLRGFDVDHGSGLEMRVGSIPINVPLHIQGQGYADANFLIPEVVRSIRVLEGPYDPRQGDAAIVGSAMFDLGVARRGYEIATTYGSFNQARVLAIAAPEGADEETFAALSLRRTDGFGANRAGQSGSINAQYGFDLGASDHLRLLATAYSAESSLAGVVREDDVAAGRIGYYDSYPYFAQGQGVRASRVITGIDFDHTTDDGGRFEIAPWLMWTDFRARRNFTGDLQVSQTNPAVSGIGDLFETTNLETAVGLTSRYHTVPAHLGRGVDVVAEPGLSLRAGETHQTKSLLDPTNLAPWDRRIDANLQTLDAGAYLDLDARVLERLRFSGGLRADVLAVGIDDHLANTKHGAAGVAASPRLTAEYALAPDLSAVVSYGEGFRSLAAENLEMQNAGQAPYSKVRSAEGGFRAQTRKGRYTTTLSVFQTWVGNELVFDAVEGGLDTESASVRRGMVGSLVAKPADSLVVSTALSVTSATYTAVGPGASRYVPSVPSILSRWDVSARHELFAIDRRPVVGRVGIGYTFLYGRHLTDAIVGAPQHALNASLGARYGLLELDVDAYNVLGLEYPDDEEVYVSNWSLLPGQHPGSLARHITAAAPRTVLGTLALHF